MRLSHSAILHTSCSKDGPIAGISTSAFIAAVPIERYGSNLCHCEAERAIAVPRAAFIDLEPAVQFRHLIDRAKVQRRPLRVMNDAWRCRRVAIDVRPFRQRRGLRKPCRTVRWSRDFAWLGWFDDLEKITVSAETWSLHSPSEARHMPRKVLLLLTVFGLETKNSNDLTLKVMVLSICFRVPLWERYRLSY